MLKPKSLFDKEGDKATLPEALVTVLREKRGWIRLDLVRPDEALQRSIRSLLWSVTFFKDVFITEVEWAVDFFPIDRKDLIRLRRALTHELVLPFARGKRAGETFRRIGGEDLQGATDYWASGGDKRRPAGKGAGKGITCYMKPQEGPYQFVRVEVLANSPCLKKIGIDINSLPIKPEAVNLLDHIAFRRGIENDGLWKLINAIAKKKWGPDWAKGEFSMARKARFRALHHRLERELDPEKSVAQQLDALKREVQKYGLSTNLPEKLFPRLEAPAAYSL